MSDVIDALNRLDALAQELDRVSRELQGVEEEFAPIQHAYRKRVSDVETGYWDRHVKHGDKLPPERLREALARRTMDANLSLHYDTLVAKRERLRQRLRDLKADVDAQRSLVSAAKSELEATR